MLASTGALPFKSPFKRWGKHKGGKGGKAGQQQQQSGSSKRNTGNRHKVQCEIRVGSEQGLLSCSWHILMNVQDGLVRFGTFDDRSLVIMFVSAGVVAGERRCGMAA